MFHRGVPVIPPPSRTVYIHPANPRKPRTRGRSSDSCIVQTNGTPGIRSSRPNGPCIPNRLIREFHDTGDLANFPIAFMGAEVEWKSLNAHISRKKVLRRDRREIGESRFGIRARHPDRGWVQPSARTSGLTRTVKEPLEKLTVRAGYMEKERGIGYRNLPRKVLVPKGGTALERSGAEATEDMGTNGGGHPSRLGVGKRTSRPFPPDIAAAADALRSFMTEGGWRYHVAQWLSGMNMSPNVLLSGNWDRIVRSWVLPGGSRAPRTWKLRAELDLPPVTPSQRLGGWSVDPVAFRPALGHPSSSRPSLRKWGKYGRGNTSSQGCDRMGITKGDQQSCRKEENAVIVPPTRHKRRRLRWWWWKRGNGIQVFLPKGVGDSEVSHRLQRFIAAGRERNLETAAPHD
ncbi:hypothetical protein BJ322DRAFT_1017611 [Thelephora terrestris]|uniref:Uncharacterized protein n=1 Tax=Thelephora terrestris TaxID=56493 RepID=A0A9P6LAP7_9AGAM|nr:hypothetical protein BJ322DRAFT_1017611 [Thelephora terrestris]